MATAKQVMTVALSYLGVKESPANSNNVKFNTAYYGHAVNGSWYPWCVVYVWYCFREAGASDLFYDGKKVNNCTNVATWAKNNGLVVNKNSGQYGDLVLFDWGKDGEPDHIGFIEKRNSNGSYVTIEGNTSYGNDSNGGEVMRRTRYLSTIYMVIRPKYSAEEKKVTYKEWLSFMEQYNNELAKKEIDMTDKTDWKVLAYNFTQETGVSDGLRPFSHVTRVELWGMLRKFYELIKNLIRNEDDLK